MKIVSMVPSWTETLIACGLEVVGRTRYCIHPQSEIKIVGGTKDWNLDLIRDLNPDFILLDREENTKEMFEAWPEKCVVTHIAKVEDLPSEIANLAKIFESTRLLEISNRWQRVSSLAIIKRDFSKIPSVLKWIAPPQKEIEELVYVIWRSPWMAVSPETFIASMMIHLGFGDKIRTSPKKYYEFEIGHLSQQSLLLFSSEPFPFLKKQEGLKELGFASAIVNGEDYSWFGIRSLEFLETHKGR